MKTQTLLKLSLIVLPCIALVGCTTTRYQVPAVKAIDYPATNKIALAVELRMPDHYRKTEWTRESGALVAKNTHHELIGDALVANAEECARAVFEKVIPTSQATNAPLAAGAQALLIPHVVRFDLVPVELMTTIHAYNLSIEWALYDPKGACVWSKEVAAVTREKRWAWSMREEPKNAYPSLFSDLFTESFSAMAGAPEIRALVAK